MKSKDLFVIGHLGLGDLLIMQGAIRKLSETRKPRRLFVLVRECFLGNAVQILKGISNIELKTTRCNWITDVNIDTIVPSDFTGNILDRWWYNYPGWGEHTIYTSLGFSLEDRYKYKIPRDIERETEIYQQVIKEQNYIFIHDDPTRGHTIKLDKIPNYYGQAIIKSSELQQYTLMDLLAVLDKAKECHVIYSSFAMLIDLMCSSKMYIHEKYINKIKGALTPEVYKHLKARDIVLI